MTNFLFSPGLKEISPPTFNLKKLFTEETVSTEPILILISAGADPSHDLQELASDCIGQDRYHQVRYITYIHLHITYMQA